MLRMPLRCTIATLAGLVLSACVADPYTGPDDRYLMTGPQPYVSTARTADPPPPLPFPFENARSSAIDVQTFRQPTASEREQKLTAERLAQYQLVSASTAGEPRWSTSMDTQAPMAATAAAAPTAASAIAPVAARTPMRTAPAARDLAAVGGDGSCYVRLSDSAGEAGLYPVLCPDALNWKKVRELQVALKCNGYDPGPIDGKLGPRTIAGVNAYRRAYRLPAHAYVDVDTLRALGVGGD